jgi:hypothetical protein
VAPSRAALSQLVDQGSRICCVIFALLGCSCSLYVCVSFFPAKRVFDVQVDKRPYTLNFVLGKLISAFKGIKGIKGFPRFPHGIEGEGGKRTFNLSFAL